MTEEREPASREAAADLLVYAPVGLPVAAREIFPSLVDRGRIHLGNQVNLARVVGQLAVRQARTSSARSPRRHGPRPRRWSTSSPRVWVSANDDPFPADETPASPEPVATPDPARPSRRRFPTRRPSPSPITTRWPLQVVSRLEGLSDAELEVLFEETHRGRRTVLGRITQAQG